MTFPGQDRDPFVAIRRLELEVRALKTRTLRAVGVNAAEFTGVLSPVNGGTGYGLAGSPLGTTVWENDTGGEIQAGSPVVWSGDRLADTTSTDDDEDVIGVFLDTVEDGEQGRVRHTGYVDAVRVTGAVAVGEYLKCSTTSGRADATSTRSAGAFAVALTANASGDGEVAAHIFPAGSAAGGGSGGPGEFYISFGSEPVSGQTLSP